MRENKTVGVPYVRDRPQGRGGRSGRLLRIDEAGFSHTAWCTAVRSLGGRSDCTLYPVRGYDLSGSSRRRRKREREAVRAIKQACGGRCASVSIARGELRPAGGGNVMAHMDARKREFFRRAFVPSEATLEVIRPYLPGLTTVLHARVEQDWLAYVGEKYADGTARPLVSPKKIMSIGLQDATRRRGDRRRSACVRPDGQHVRL